MPENVIQEYQSRSNQTTLVHTFEESEEALQLMNSVPVIIFLPGNNKNAQERNQTLRKAMMDTAQQFESDIQSQRIIFIISEHIMFRNMLSSMVLSSNSDESSIESQPGNPDQPLLFLVDKTQDKKFVFTGHPQQRYNFMPVNNDAGSNPTDSSSIAPILKQFIQEYQNNGLTQHELYLRSAVPPENNQLSIFSDAIVVVSKTLKPLILDEPRPSLLFTYVSGHKKCIETRKYVITVARVLEEMRQNFTSDKNESMEIIKSNIPKIGLFSLDDNEIDKQSFELDAKLPDLRLYLSQPDPVPQDNKRPFIRISETKINSPLDLIKLIHEQLLHEDSRIDQEHVFDLSWAEKALATVKEREAEEEQESQKYVKNIGSEDEFMEMLSISNTSNTSSSSSSTKESVDENSSKSMEKRFIIELGASWCPPCKIISPMIYRMGLQYQDRIQFVLIDIDAVPDLADRCDVESLPTFIGLKSNPQNKGSSKWDFKAEEIGKMEGIDESKLIQLISKVLKN